MRFFLLPLLLIVSFQAFAADPVLKFTLTKADGTQAGYEFFVPNASIDQSAPLSQDEAVRRQHNAGVAALTWEKKFYGAHDTGAAVNAPSPHQAGSGAAKIEKCQHVVRVDKLEALHLKGVRIVGRLNCKPCFLA